jgi:uncharacterized protein involved in type VI secretion and phage assembly
MFYGKFRGKVADNHDPLMLGRIIPLVPAISELPLSWALPNAPFAGPDVGFFALPPIGANVWIEFEGGDANYPVWTGCFWGEGQVPAQPALPTALMLKTQRVALSIDDLTAELRLEARTPTGLQMVVLNSEGIELSSDLIDLTVTSEGITLKSGAASVEVTPAAIDIRNGAASAQITAASIGLKNGAASVDLYPASVSLNNGALEVT